MNKFVKGMLVGIGIGLLVAPMKGEETRRKIGERIQQLRAYLPEGDQLNSYKQQVSERVSQTTDSLKGYAQQAASTVKSGAKSTVSSLSEIAQNATSITKQTGKDIADTTRETVSSVKTDTNV
jgi:gas vesicle protein